MKNFLTIVLLSLVAFNQLLAFNLPKNTLNTKLIAQLDSAGKEKEEEKTDLLVDKNRISTLEISNYKNTFTLSKYRTLQEEVLFSNEKLNVRKIYPNPASSVAFLDYQMIESIQAKVTIRNLLGKVVREYDLEKGDKQIKIPTIRFEAGIYFYTLSINGKALKAKKLVIDHH
jgi:Secretion system C-terminal sorting domain